MTMTSWKRLAPAALAGIVFASLPLPAAAQTPIKIGASMSVTGTYAKPGTYQKQGYDVCIDELNAKGGVLGRKVEFVIYDDQSNPATAVRLYEKLITEDKVDAVMGPYSSAVSEAVANVTEKYKKVMVAPLAATTSIFKKGRKYIFMVITARRELPGRADRHGGQARAQDGRPSSTRTRSFPRRRRRGSSEAGQEEAACRSCCRRPTRRAIPTSRRCW